MKFGKIEQGQIKVLYNDTELAALAEVPHDVDSEIYFAVNKAQAHVVDRNWTERMPINIDVKLAGKMTDELLRRKVLTETELVDSF